MKRRTKRQMVIEIYDREAMGEVTAREIAQINRGLIAEFGEGGVMSPAEIARVLNDEGLPVRFDQVFAMITPEERYQSLFDGVLNLETLVTAQASLRRIDELYRKFQRLGDRQGLRFARAVALEGKRLAVELVGRHSLGDDERAEKAEMAQWFTVWLQTPDLFEQWLELRKAAPDFKRAFADQLESLAEKSRHRGR
jgi:hypothetical protein